MQRGIRYCPIRPAIKSSDFCNRAAIPHPHPARHRCNKSADPPGNQTAETSMALKSPAPDPVQILLTDEADALPKQPSTAAAGQLVVRGYVLDPEDFDQPRLQILSQPSRSTRGDFGARPARRRAEWQPLEVTRRWQTAAAQAASGKMPASRPALRRRHPAGAGRSAPPAGS